MLCTETVTVRAQDHHGGKDHGGKDHGRKFITKHEITIAQHLPGGTIPVQPLPSRNIVARLRQIVCLCAGIFAHALRSPKLAHLKQNEREPHNQEMYTVPNTVDTTRWGEHIHGSPRLCIWHPVHVDDSGPQNLTILAVILFFIR